MKERKGFVQKTSTFEIKEIGEDLVLEGYASTFGFPADRHGDIIHPDAFNKSLEKINTEGLPFLDSHDNSCMSLLGTIFYAHVDNHGLYIKVKFVDTPSVREIYQKAKQGHVKTMSIGFNLLEGRYVDGETKDADTVFEITDADLLEVSLVPIPANPLAMVTAVKSLLKNLEEFNASQIHVVNIEKEIPTYKFSKEAEVKDVRTETSDAKYNLLKTYLKNKVK